MTYHSCACKPFMFESATAQREYSNNNLPTSREEPETHSTYKNIVNTINMSQLPVVIQRLGPWLCWWIIVAWWINLSIDFSNTCNQTKQNQRLEHYFFHEDPFKLMKF